MNLKANSGDSPLHAAAEDGHTDVVKALLAAGRPSCSILL